MPAGELKNVYQPSPRPTMPMHRGPGAQGGTPAHHPHRSSESSTTGFGRGPSPDTGARAASTAPSAAPSEQRGYTPPSRPPSAGPTQAERSKLHAQSGVAGVNAKNDVFDKSTRFADLGLTEEVLRGVTDAGFEFPTAIQAQIIPLLLTGRDILGQAKTGTGKTAAFGLPVLSRAQKGAAYSAMVLVPTRELAIQVAADLNELGRHTGLTALPVYGGQNITTQAQRLARGPEIIVATPGRVMDMHQRGYLHYRDIKMIVLDEVDRMLDIGFRDDIRKILASCPKDRQTIFVSATMQPEVEALARSFARDAEKIVATSGSLTATMVKQYHLPVEPWDKKQLLLHLLTHESPALTLVFCRTKKTVDNLTEYLMRKGIDAHAMHGDMYQAKRNKVIERLKSGSLSVLIASDLASRGLDVEGITHVINYDLPEDPDLYVHRIGRTARAGRDGIAWALVTPEQGELLTQIEMLINAEIPKLDYPDFVPGPLPEDVRVQRDAESRRRNAPPAVSRFAAAPIAPAPVAAAGGSGVVVTDASKFPGGIVPSKLPDKRLGGRVRSARSMRGGGGGAGAPPPPAPNGTAGSGEPTGQA